MIFFNLPFKTLNITGCYSIIPPFKDDFKLQILCHLMTLTFGSKTL